MGERRTCSTFNNKEMSFEIIWGCSKENITEKDFFNLQKQNRSDARSLCKIIRLWRVVPSLSIFIKDRSGIDLKWSKSLLTCRRFWHMVFWGCNEALPKVLKIRKVRTQTCRGWGEISLVTKTCLLMFYGVFWSRVSIHSG